nr:MAG TPA: Minor structural protein 4 [Caudoviricetes sp.]
MADEKKTYTLTTATVPSRPRSKTRREGEGLTTGGASAIVESATAGNAQRAAHSETANEAAHAAEAVHALNADNAKNATHADEATHAAHAETATSATTAAHSNTADTATRAQSAQTADHAATAATAARAEQAQRATEAETLRTPNFADGLNTGAGARIDATGNAEFQSMAVRGFFRAAEYQINRIALSEGDVFHTENGLVKSAVRQADGRWKVVLQERFQGDVTGFRAGDVLRGAYNSVGTSGGTAEIRTSWLRVEAVDAKAGTLTASLYADNQTPEGRNAPPVPLMRLARWGNTTDPERQSHIVESATEGRIVRRVKVSAPIVDGTQSDGFVVGKLPAWLREHFGAAVADASDYVFARGIITQNILRYTPAGHPLAERVDRGLWSASARYFYEEQNPETGAFEISRVWHDGALYELARGGNGNTAPAANSTHWTLIQAKPKDGKDSPAQGVNLLDGTNFNTSTPIYASPRNPKWTEVRGRVTVLPGGMNGTNVVCAMGQVNVIRASIPGEKLTVGKTYVVSFWYRTDGNLHLWDNYPDNGYRLRTNPERPPHSSPAEYNDGALHHSVEWKRYTQAFTWHGTSPHCGIYVDINDADSGKWIEICGLKVEEGDTPTTWCLSENDKIGTAGTDGRDGESYHANLLEDSAFKKGFDQWNQEGRLGVFDDTQTSPVPGTRVVRYDTAMLGDLPFSSIVQSVAGRLRPNTTYTFSAWVKTSQGLQRATILFAFKPIASLDISYQHDGEWARCAFTFTTFPEKNDDQSIRLRLNKQEGEASVWFAAPKLEVGDTPTEWTPSENDRKGEKGDPGKSSYTHVAYSNSPDGNPCTLDPKGEKFAYLGTYTDENEAASTAPARYVWAKVQGEKGDNGRGVSRMRAFYMLPTERNAPPPDMSGWTEAAPQPTKERPWLWSYERSEYSDGTADETTVRLIGHYGKDGTNGTSIRAQYSADAQTWHDDFAEGDVWMRTGNGTTWGGALRVVGESGTDGKSPVYDFAASSQLATASGTTAPTIRGTWQDAPPTLRDGEVLWYRLTAANGKITYGRLSGEKGRNSYTHIAYANSADGAKDFTMEEDLGRGGEIEFSYFGIYADFDEGASQDYHDYVWTRLRGVDGKDGLTPNANLLDDTDFKNLGRKESAWKIGTHGEEPVAGRANISIFSSAVDGCVPALCAINPGTKDGEYAQLFQNVGQLIPGRTYTFSAYVRGADAAWLIVYPTPAEHFHPNTVKQDGWTRVSLTFRAPAVQDPDGVLLLLRAWHRETTPHTGYAKSVVWCAPKLEEGDRATQWCPSFRDQRGADGSPGVRGAAVRLLGDYDRLADGTTFESGHAGETYLDVVQVRQGEQVQFYQCKQPHAKSADKAPAADSEWWELGTYQGFVATDLLLARRSLIKNLQVENVVGRDKRGNATFELDAETGAAYIGGTATFAGFIRRRPVVITPENWKEYGGKMGRNGDVFYLNPFAVGTYVIFHGDFGALRPTIDTSNDPLAEGRAELTEDNSHLMRYYGAQFMVFNDTPTSLFIGGMTIGTKDTAVFTMLGRKRENPLLWWKGEIVKPW